LLLNHAVIGLGVETTSFGRRDRRCVSASARLPCIKEKTTERRCGCRSPPSLTILCEFAIITAVAYLLVLGALSSVDHRCDRIFPMHDTGQSNPENMQDHERQSDIRDRAM